MDVCEVVKSFQRAEEKRLKTGLQSHDSSSIAHRMSMFDASYIMNRQRNARYERATNSAGDSSQLVLYVRNLLMPFVSHVATLRNGLLFCPPIYSAILATKFRVARWKVHPALNSRVIMCVCRWYASFLSLYITLSSQTCGSDYIPRLILSAG